MTPLVGLPLAFSLQHLPIVNALLNGTAALLLVVGYVLIKQRREVAHKRVMITAFATSIVFLACYLLYHYDLKSRTGASGVPFTGPSPVREAYYAMLISHVLLAVAVPVLASMTIYLGLRDRRQRHLRLARWTYPIWMYVSVTGVAIYLMLYHLYPAAEKSSTIAGAVRPTISVDR